MKTKRLHFRTSAPQRAGFTLVELMVAMGLAVLMMGMFTIVFRISAGTVSQQRGIAHNDQKARTVVTILRNDFRYRTFRSVIPFNANEVAPGVGDLSFNLRRGYFYVSENDPDNDLDDVVQFTVELPPGERYFGKAQPIIPNRASNWAPGTPYGPGQSAGSWVQPTAGQVNNLVYYAETPGVSGLAEPAWPAVEGGQIADGTVTWRAYSATNNRNQPESDDGEDGNQTGSSTYATISLFVRGGTLYRRVMLIREPLDTTYDDQPRHIVNGTNWIQTVYNGPSFWADFDYSAFPARGADPFATFHGRDSLDNDPLGPAGITGIGRPPFRFGHNAADGQPLEYLSTGEFLGRFTHQETSDPQFTYPHRPTGNPFDRGNSMGLTYDSARNVVVPFAEGARRAEDSLLFQVLRFDVDVWDSAANRFVDIGGTGAVDFARALNRHTVLGITYGPNNQAQNNVFDTWHPSYDHGNNATIDPPPYRPVRGLVPVRMRAIRITIQYLDPGTQQVRQVTMVQSLMDNQPRP